MITLSPHVPGLAKRVRAKLLMASTSEVYGGMFSVFFKPFSTPGAYVDKAVALCYVCR